MGVVHYAMGLVLVEEGIYLNTMSVVSSRMSIAIPSIAQLSQDRDRVLSYPEYSPSLSSFSVIVMGCIVLVVEPPLFIQISHPYILS
jgi:hypothetical protein